MCLLHCSPKYGGPRSADHSTIFCARRDHLRPGVSSRSTLLGQNVNSYGRDITRRRPLFADLLRAVGAVEGIERVRFTSPHPKDLRPETIEAMAQTDAVCEHLHLPLQSGSDRVLAAMRRGYNASGTCRDSQQLVGRSTTLLSRLTSSSGFREKPKMTSNAL